MLELGRVESGRRFRLGRFARRLEHGLWHGRRLAAVARSGLALGQRGEPVAHGAGADVLAHHGQAGFDEFLDGSGDVDLTEIERVADAPHRASTTDGGDGAPTRGRDDDLVAREIDREGHPVVERRDDLLDLSPLFEHGLGLDEGLVDRDRAFRGLGLDVLVEGERAFGESKEVEHHLEHRPVLGNACRPGSYDRPFSKVDRAGQAVGREDEAARVLGRVQQPEHVR